MRENAEDAEAEAAGRRLAAKREKQAAQTSHDFWHAIADNVTGDDRIVALNEARVALGGDSTAEAEAAGRRLAAKREELRGQLLHDFWHAIADNVTGDDRIVALNEARVALGGESTAEAEAAGRRLAAKREELRGRLLHDFWRERADQATGDERTVALYEARKALKGKPPAAG